MTTTHLAQNEKNIDIGIQRHIRTKKWVIPMLNDDHRNKLYESSIRSACEAAVQRLKEREGEVLQNDKIRILDIGSGTGEFLNRAVQHGYKVDGIEPSKDARKQAIQNFQVPVFEESHLSTLQSNSYDFITMWHVLEHVYHLNDRVAELKRLIKKGGHILIAVPNLKSYDAQKYKEHWAAYDVPRHLYHFSETDIKSLALKHDLEVVQTLPMKFDSYYVSLLSEKYKNGQQNLVSAFLAGLKSNSVAQSGGGYSSQIYVIKSK
jgi:2-polyprenyl-3-methyl-5-hydroxy-6-metoxy-1,4-benzoquinol methylase